MGTDQIMKKVRLHSPKEIVWRALSDSTEFGQWFGMEFNSSFTPGLIMKGVTVPTTVNAQIAELQRPYEGTPVEITIEEMEPEHLFSFRWRPCSLDFRTSQPTTLIVFEIKEAPGGVLLTVTESGFECIPAENRAKAMAMNEQGWDMVLQLLTEHLAQLNAQN